MYYFFVLIDIYNSFWEETPFSIFPNIHVKFVLKQSVNFIYGCRKVAENLPPRLFASTPGRKWERERERGINSWNASPFPWIKRSLFPQVLWNVTCCDNDYMNVVMNTQAHLAYVYIYIFLFWIQIVYEHASCMSVQMQAFEVKNSWKLGLQLVVGQVTSWQLLLTVGSGKRPSFGWTNFLHFHHFLLSCFPDGLIFVLLATKLARQYIWVPNLPWFQWQ